MHAGGKRLLHRIILLERAHAQTESYASSSPSGPEAGQGISTMNMKTRLNNDMQVRGALCCSYKDALISALSFLLARPGDLQSRPSSFWGLKPFKHFFSHREQWVLCWSSVPSLPYLIYFKMPKTSYDPALCPTKVVPTHQLSVALCFTWSRVVPLACTRSPQDADEAARVKHEARWGATRFQTLGAW